MIRHAHHHNCAHRANFALTCDAYDRLLERADDRCEICQMTRAQAKVGNWYLGIDHDHKVGWFGIRGLLCQCCNGRLRKVDAGTRPPTDMEAPYLSAEPFWRTLTLSDFTKKGAHDLQSSLFWAWLDTHGPDLQSLIASTNGLRAVSVGGKTRP